MSLTDYLIRTHQFLGVTTETWGLVWGGFYRLLRSMFRTQANCISPSSTFPFWSWRVLRVLTSHLLNNRMEIVGVRWWIDSIRNSIWNRIFLMWVGRIARGGSLRIWDKRERWSIWNLFQRRKSCMVLWRHWASLQEETRSQQSSSNHPQSCPHLVEKA